MQNDTNTLQTILDALRKEVLQQGKFQVEPTTISVTNLVVNEYEPVKAVIRVNFRPAYILVGR